MNGRTSRQLAVSVPSCPAQVLDSIQQPRLLRWIFPSTSTRRHKFKVQLSEHTNPYTAPCEVEFPGLLEVLNTGAQEHHQLKTSTATTLVVHFS